MPLIESGSPKALQENIKTEIEHGEAPKQAAAIAYSTQRANDYTPMAVETAPAGVTLQSLNEKNRQYWEQGND